MIVKWPCMHVFNVKSETDDQSSPHAVVVLGISLTEVDTMLNHLDHLDVPVEEPDKLERLVGL